MSLETGFHPSLEVLQGMKDMRYEEHIVKVLLKRYKLPDAYKYALLKHHHRLCGNWRLMLVHFAEFFPTFPIQLEAMKIPYSRNRHPVSKLFNGLHKLPVYLEYEIRESQRYDPSKPFGLVFEWPHLRMGGGLVLHDHPINVDVSGTRMLWISGIGRQLVIEPLSVLLETIDRSGPEGKGWKPEPDVLLLDKLPPRLAEACTTHIGNQT